MSGNSIKCVAVGDGAVGKTTLLHCLCGKDSDAVYQPTVFDNFSISKTHNGKDYEIIFIDTAGQEEYNLLRKQLYDSTDIFLVCFSVSSSTSFLNVKGMWLREIEECPTANKILIGTKSDLRNDPETIDNLNISGEIFVSPTMATNFAKSHNMDYIECSSKTQENIEEIIKNILELKLRHKYVKDILLNKHSSTCCINPILKMLKRAICCKH